MLFNLHIPGIRCIITGILLFNVIMTVHSQEKLTFSGGISLGGEGYSVTGISNRRSPLSYYINGRFSLSYKGVAIPVSISYRDAQFSYDYNFNRLGIAPSYKWIKLYLGWNTMNFSQYTLSGRAFYGVGLALTPGNFQLSALKGKIQNLLAIKDTLVNGANLIPAYERELWGVKIGFAKEKNKFELIVMNIKDDTESFEYDKEYTSAYGYQVLTPKENLIIGINGGVSLYKIVDLYFNTAASAFTADKNDTLLINYGTEVPSFISDIFKANSSTRLSFAGDAGISIRIKTQKFGFKYRRVDPFYTTLASNFFMNDVQQYTFQTNLNFWNKKIQLDGNLGLEQNNLTQLRLSTSNRVISSIGLNYNYKESWFATVRFTNFQTESENQILNLQDTLRFVSTTREYSSVLSYMMPNNTWKKSFTIHGYYNTVRDLSVEKQIGDIKVFSLQVNTTIGWKPRDINLTPSILFNSYDYSNINQKRIGGGLRIQKSFLKKKVIASINGQHSLNLIDQKKDGTVSYIQLSSQYKIDKKNSINLQASFRSSKSLINSSFDEFRLLVRYGIQF